MPHHEWGDEDFNWEQLNAAMHWIVTFYRRMTKKQMFIKEKYGTIRYEFIEMWCTDGRQSLILCEIAKRAAIKFPEVSAEIVDDLICTFHFVPPVNVYVAYFAGITWGKCQGRLVGGKKEKWYCQK